jgi:hypothetical protein
MELLALKVIVWCFIGLAVFYVFLRVLGFLLEVLLWLFDTSTTVTRRDLYRSSDETWKSGYQIWTEAHQEKELELDTSMPLELAMQYLDSFEKWFILEKQDRSYSEFSETDNKVFNQAQSTFYRRKKIWGEPDRGKKRIPLRQLRWDHS